MLTLITNHTARFAVVGAAVFGGATAFADDKVDFQASQALGGLRSMRNHLDVAPNTKIVVVAHGDGIDFLTTEYEAADTVGPLVGGLAARGVVFEVCEITMARQELTQDDFVLEAEFVPSGVARISQLQAHENYAYMKP